MMEELSDAQYHQKIRPSERKMNYTVTEADL